MSLWHDQSFLSASCQIYFLYLLLHRPLGPRNSVILWSRVPCYLQVEAQLRLTSLLFNLGAGKPFKTRAWDGLDFVLCFQCLISFSAGKSVWKALHKSGILIAPRLAPLYSLLEGIASCGRDKICILKSVLMTFLFFCLTEVLKQQSS